jgi:hypothetical protein
MAPAKSVTGGVVGGMCSCTQYVTTGKERI